MTPEQALAELRDVVRANADAQLKIGALLLSSGLRDGIDTGFWTRYLAALDALIAERDRLRAELEQAKRLRLLADWHEDIGPVLWWAVPCTEPPWVGGPLDSDWPGYHTHWSPLPEPDGLDGKGELVEVANG